MFKEIIASFFAAATFAFLLNQPRKTIPLSSCIAALGYLLFILAGKGTFAYFAAAFFISVSSEITARILKKAATIFAISALIPLIPGIGLYRTMRYLVIQQTAQAATEGIETTLAFCAIALGISFSLVIFSNIHIMRGNEKLPRF